MEMLVRVRSLQDRKGKQPEGRCHLELRMRETQKEKSGLVRMPGRLFPL